MTARKLVLSLCTTAAVAAFATPAHAAPPVRSDVAVCNEAENSWQGGYTVNGGPVDPNPPAFLKGGPGAQMRVGNGDGAGLVNAAEHSPALRTCGPGDGDGDGGGGDPVFDV